MNSQPLFLTNTARSGSYLISMMMSANPDLMVASEPYLELFRSWRNALVRENAPSAVRAKFDPSSPFCDYYFTDERLEIMDAVQRGSLNVGYDSSEWDDFLARSVPRVSLQCAELAPHLHRMRGDDYREMFDRAFDIIADARQAHDRRWIGIKDAWIIEFFKPLAEAYRDAKFIVILRDPRAMVNSMLGVVNEDPLQVAHVLSYARHWRKYAAFINYYRSIDLFRDRLHFVTHEQVLADPEREAHRLCEFLEVDFHAAMLDTDAFHDFSTGGTWNGNSSFESSTRGISSHRAERWKSRLADEIVRTVDLVCGPDMESLGFQPRYELDGHCPEVLDYLIRADQEYTNWRSDLGDVQLDYACELFRLAILGQEEAPSDMRLVRRSFLFSEVYDFFRARRARMAAA